ncbi:MAG: hypothetical protein R2715_03795 [Ilumatobacteraceae bacterium]
MGSYAPLSVPDRYIPGPLLAISPGGAMVVRVIDESGATTWRRGRLERAEVRLLVDSLDELSNGPTAEVSSTDDPSTIVRYGTERWIVPGPSEGGESFVDGLIDYAAIVATEAWTPEWVVRLDEDGQCELRPATTPATPGDVSVVPLLPHLEPEAAEGPVTCEALDEP